MKINTFRGDLIVLAKKEPLIPTDSSVSDGGGNQRNALFYGTFYGCSKAGCSKTKVRDRQFYILRTR